jgi:hypothetical protein
MKIKTIQKITKVIHIATAIVLVIGIIMVSLWLWIAFIKWVAKI